MVCQPALRAQWPGQVCGRCSAVIATEPIALQALADRSKQATSAVSRLGFISAWCSGKPILAIILVSGIAVFLNCYPIIFCGRSYVSPASVQSLVYDYWPTAPSLKRSESFVPQHGSDVGAMMWWDVPLGFLQSRALFDYKELPLWNRYSHAGAPLMSQAVSMLGDPLHLIVIFGRGSALAWDLKFLTAKFLFCIGFGCVILQLQKSAPLALIYSAMASYCGAYFYIASHPVFFVLTYAPWILLSAMKLLDPARKTQARWWLAWLISNVGCFCGGHVEVALDLIAGMNLVALANALVRENRTGQSLRIIAKIATATLLFLGITAPVWVSFLVALQGSYTMHSEVKVEQQTLSSLPGAFDDEFFKGMAHFAPGTSLLVMAGAILSILHWRKSRGSTFFWVNSTIILVWGGCVFGWIPATLLARVPFWNKVGHLYADISYLLAIHLTIQSAYGFWSLSQEANFRKIVTSFLAVILIFLLVLWEYSFLLPWVPARWYYFLYVGLAGIGAPLLYCYLKSSRGWIPPLGWVGIVTLGLISQHRFGLYTFGNKGALMVPGPRVRLDAPSESLEHLKARNSDPFRIVSLKHRYEGALSGDYSAVYGLEDIRSCAPLANGEYVALLANFPGMTFSHGWVIGLTNPVMAQPLLNMLNVKYVLTGPTEPFTNSTPFRIADQNDFVALENPDVWPRAFFVDKLLPVASVEQFSQQLLKRKKPFVSVNTEDIQKHVELRQLLAASEVVVIPASQYSLRQNTTAFKVHAPSSGFVCLSESRAKDFSVKVNNQPREVITANRVFKGVYLDHSGDYEVQFTYRPRFWNYTCGAFWVSLSILGVIMARAALPGCLRRSAHMSSL